MSNVTRLRPVVLSLLALILFALPYLPVSPAQATILPDLLGHSGIRCPPLPPPAAPMATVAAEKALRDQAHNAQPGTTILVAAGTYHNCAVKEDGSIVAWGSNGYGQCDLPTPYEGFTTIAAGDYFGLGLKEDGWLGLSFRPHRKLR